MTAGGIGIFARPELLWVVGAALLAMFMQVGFAMIETGFSRSKNALHTVAINLMVFPLGIIGFFLTGYALMDGSGGRFSFLTPALPPHELVVHLFSKSLGLLGTRHFALLGEDLGGLAAFLLTAVFMNVAATIATGAMVERWKFSAFFIYTLFVSMFLYPLYADWMWGGGWLAQLGTDFGLGHGAVDFAGSAVVHLAGGLVALAGTIVMGPRIGRFKRDGIMGAMPGHNLPMAVLGSLVVAFGWMGLNCAGVAAPGDGRVVLIAVNSTLAAAAGALIALLIIWRAFRKPDIAIACNGLLGGLAAISASCAFVSPASALAIGAIAGALVAFVVPALEHEFMLDDPVGAIAVHGAGGAWGALAVGIFANGTYGANWNGVPGTVRGLLYGDGGQLAAQLIAIVVSAIVVFGLALLFFVVIEELIGNRVPAEVEWSGLDALEMGSEAYPKN